MGYSKILLPGYGQISVFNAAPREGVARKYLNAVRMSISTPCLEAEYMAMIPKFQEELVLSIAKQHAEFDAVVCARSSREDALPYKDAILKRWEVPDLSDNFSRKGVKRSSESMSLHEIIDEFSYSADGSESTLRSVLIVDDFCAEGKTAASIISHLREAGLGEDAEITLAVIVNTAPPVPT